MANTYFQFKQFTIHQDKTAMKVTTDGCLFGALAAQILNTLKVVEPAVLDIGAGTGLLSLMIAQQNATATIDLVEIDEAAASQAEENIHGATSFPVNATIYQTSIQQFKATNNYHFIISNPPFYEQQLASPNQLKSQAHHSSHLTLEELFIKTAGLLNPAGIFFVLLPYYRETEAIEKAAQLANWRPIHIIRAKQTLRHHYFRSMIGFSFQSHIIPEEKEIIIKDVDNNYSLEFTTLLKPYYLHL